MSERMTLMRRQETYRTCAVCHRTLLQGERASRYSPDGEEWVDVCPLCLDTANEYGWLKEGTPKTPIVPDAPRRRRRRSWNLGSLFEQRREESDPVVADPVLRRLSPEEHLLVDAAELFNRSSHSRTIAGVAKSLGEARVSMIPLSGTNAEVVITVAWEISWYQYRVVLDSSQPVRLEERGQDIDDLRDRFREWNASFDAQNRLRPDIARL